MSDLPEDLSEKTPRPDLEQAAAEVGVPDPAALPNKEALLKAIEEARPNPAIVPDPVERTERTYKVVGPRVVHGTKPGDTFTKLITEQQEASLIEAGHILPTTDKDT